MKPVKCCAVLPGLVTGAKGPALGSALVILRFLALSPGIVLVSEVQWGSGAVGRAQETWSPCSRGVRLLLPPIFEVWFLSPVWPPLPGPHPKGRSPSAQHVGGLCSGVNPP